MAPQPGSPSDGRFPAAACATRLRHALLAVLLGVLFAAPAAAAAVPERRVTFDIPAGEALGSLKRAAQQSGVEIMFAAEAVEGVRTNAVKGELTAREALSRMLAGTGLLVVRDERSGAIAVRSPFNPRRAKGSSGDNFRQDNSTPSSHMNPPRSSRFTGLLLKAALLPATVFGQTPAPTAPSDETLKLSPFEVKSDRDYGYRATNAITGTRTGAPILETPLNIAVLTEDFLTDIDAQNLNEAVEYISGISTAALGNNGRTGGGSGDTTRIRGFEIPFQVRNGFRRNRNVTVRNVDRVEVVKGPVSLLFGQSTPGGIINYITKKPRFANAGSLKTTLGTHNLWSVEAEAEAALKVFNANEPDFAVRVLASREDTDLYRDFEFRSEDYVTGQVAWRPSPTLSLLAEFEYMDQKSNLAQGLPWGNPQWSTDYAAALAAGRTADVTRWHGSRPNWLNDIQARTNVRPADVTGLIESAYPRGRLWDYNLSGPDTRFNARSQSSSIEANWSPSPKFSLRFGGNLYRVHYFEKFMFVDTPNADDTFSLFGFASRNNDQVFTTGQLDAVFSHDFKWLKNKFIGGVEYLNDYETVRRLSLDPIKMATEQGITRAMPPPGQPDRGSPVLNGLWYYDPRVQPPIEIDRAITGFDTPSSKQYIDQDRRAYYLSYRGELLDGRLQVVAGARRERGDTERFTPLTGARTTDVQEKTTPTFGASYKLRNDVVLFAGYSESFVPQAQLSVTGLVNPGEARPLGPQEGRGYEFGVKTGLFDNRLTGTISYYEIELGNKPQSDNLKTEQDPRNADPSFPNGIRFPFLVTHWFGGGLDRVRGIDADFVWSPTRNFQVLASVGHVIEAIVVSSDPQPVGSGIRVDGTSVQLPPLSNIGVWLRRTPKWEGAVWGKYTFLEGALKGGFVGLGAQYKSSYRPFGDSAGFAHWVQGAYSVFDFSAGYEANVFGRPTTFMLSVKNLLDERFVSGTYTPNEPRRAILSARMRF